MMPPNVNLFYAGVVIDALARRGVKLFCISPGSRSAPLTLAAADRGDIDRKVFHDERGSAFFAAGYARASGLPAAVICTSGTAVANLFPAVVEAYQSSIPLVLLTADRPEELQNVGANQTIDQKKFFGIYSPGYLTIPAPGDDTGPADILARLDAAFAASDNLPVHINCRFREPLAPIQQTYGYQRLQAEVDRWYGTHGERDRRAPAVPDDADLQAVASIINQAQECIVIAGPQVPCRQSRMISALGKKLNCPVVSDILSGGGGTEGAASIRHYDLYLDLPDLARTLIPDLIIHVGGLPTSKRLNQFLSDLKRTEYIKLQDHNRTIDPDRLETRRVTCSPDEFIGRLLPLLREGKTGEYLNRWRETEERTIAFLNDHFQGVSLSECALMYHLGGMLSGGDGLFLSSSMPVRDADAFLRADNVVIGANRGANGIDGTIASACGFAHGGRRPVTAVMGDMAFIHDLNSLAVAARSEYPVMVIVINNDGGGIFHFLPVAQFPEHFDAYFAAGHGLRFEHAAALFDLPYDCPSTVSEFQDSYHRARRRGRSAVIEVRSDRRQNLAEHENIRTGLSRYLLG